MTTPTGVSMARATQSTSEWVTRIGSMVNGPMVNLTLGSISISSINVGELVLFELAVDIGQGELGRVDRDLEFLQHPGQAADVVFVAVGEQDGANMRLVFNQVGDVGDDNINAKQLRFRKHQSGIDDDNVVFPTKRQAVHSELAQSAEGDYFQFFCLHHSSP